jgi:hypothetical protein
MLQEEQQQDQVGVAATDRAFVDAALEYSRSFFEISSLQHKVSESPHPLSTLTGDILHYRRMKGAERQKSS